MTHSYKEITKPQTYLVPVDVVCDRCGKPARIVGGGVNAVSWGACEGYIQGDISGELGGDTYRADLCKSCTDDLREWLGKGKGKGPQIGYQEPEVVG